MLDKLPAAVPRMAERGITSYRLMKLGFPSSAYYAMKRGDNISSHTINQLCKILKCNVSDIMEYIDEDVPTA